MKDLTIVFNYPDEQIMPNKCPQIVLEETEVIDYF